MRGWLCFVAVRCCLLLVRAGCLERSDSRVLIVCPFTPQYRPVAPVAYQVILEPGIGKFREFEPRRVHTRIDSLGLFLVDKLTCGKRESVS